MEIPNASILIQTNKCKTDEQNLGGEGGIGDVDKKIPDASALVATTNLNGKISGVEKKNTRCE